MVSRAVEFLGRVVSRVLGFVRSGVGAGGRVRVVWGQGAGVQMCGVGACGGGRRRCEQVCVGGESMGGGLGVRCVGVGSSVCVCVC